MFNEEIRALLAQVITSWQVIVVTVVLIIYIFLVNSVTKIRQRSGGDSSAKRRKKKIPKSQLPQPPDAPSDDDELGLEDTQKK